MLRAAVILLLSLTLAAPAFEAASSAPPLASYAAPGAAAAMLRPLAGSAAWLTEAPAAAAVTTTVETGSQRLMNVAVHAPDAQTAYVAYYRYAQGTGEYRPAELRVAKTTDGGASFTVSTVDPAAYGAAELLEWSVDVDGSGDTVYVAYAIHRSGAFADISLRLAKSVDGGATWTTGTLVPSHGGTFVAMDVIDPQRVIVAYNHIVSGYGSVRAAVTSDGGASWAHAQVEAPALGRGYYKGTAALDAQSMRIAAADITYQNGKLLLDRSADGGSSWQNAQVNADHPLGVSAASAGGSLFVSYEDANTYEVRALRSTDGGESFASTTLEGGDAGWDTSIAAVDAQTVRVGYWVPTSSGALRVGSSSDGGATWSLQTLTDPAGHFLLYDLDIGAPSAGTTYAAYGSNDLDGTCTSTLPFGCSVPLVCGLLGACSYSYAGTWSVRLARVTS